MGNALSIVDAATVSIQGAALPTVNHEGPSFPPAITTETPLKVACKAKYSIGLIVE